MNEPWSPASEVLNSNAQFHAFSLAGAKNTASNDSQAEVTRLKLAMQAKDDELQRSETGRQRLRTALAEQREEARRYASFHAARLHTMSMSVVCDRTRCVWPCAV